MASRSSEATRNATPASKVINPDMARAAPPPYEAQAGLDFIAADGNNQEHGQMGGTRLCSTDNGRAALQASEIRRREIGGDD
jgi:hypothetical protein